VSHEINFLLKFTDRLLISHVKSSYRNTDMCKFVSLQKDESRVQSTDSLRLYREPRVFNSLSDQLSSQTMSFSH